MAVPTLELHYSSGGHGGPYQPKDALPTAIRLMYGRKNERKITIRDGVGGPVVAILTRTVNGRICVSLPGYVHPGGGAPGYDLIVEE